ncbi:MAG: VIT1/CCC1 transporter family protein [Candidatus Dormibacteria bacterium]
MATENASTKGTPQMVRDTVLANWRDEMHAAALYDALVRTQKDPVIRGNFEEMRDHEREHAQFWKERLEELGGGVPPFRKGIRERLVPFMVAVLGLPSVLSSIELEETRGIVEYMEQAHNLDNPKARQTALDILPQERHHLDLVAEMAQGADDVASGAGGTRVHRLAEVVRDFVFGLNDGLLSNFSLIAGVSGANPKGSFIILAGFAGLVAGMISMAAGQYLSTKSGQDILNRSRRMRKEEIRTIPEFARDQLREQYLKQGFAREEADMIVTRITADEDRWLAALSGSDESSAQALTPLAGGIVTGIGFGVGAFIPLLPHLVATGSGTLVAAGILSVAALFVIGMVKSLFSGERPVRAGLEMAAIGVGAAVVTNLIGRLFGVAGIG